MFQIRLSLDLQQQKDLCFNDPQNHEEMSVNFQLQLMILNFGCYPQISSFEGFSQFRLLLERPFEGYSQLLVFFSSV